MLNAFAIKKGLVIGQKTINEKTNEITAIPELLDELSIEGAIVSIDAIGCQKKIAEKIIEKEAYYFLALKENQPNLYNDVRTYFGNPSESLKSCSKHETFDKGHGRIEVRRCVSSDDVAWLKQNHPAWSHLNSICMVESERHIGEKVAIERRYYVSSTQSDAVKHLAYSREHWRIENNLHWVIRKTVLNLSKLYKQKTGDKSSTATLRKASGWDNQIAGDILRELAG